MNGDHIQLFIFTVETDIAFTSLIASLLNQTTHVMISREGTTKQSMSTRTIDQTLSTIVSTLLIFTFKSSVNSAIIEVQIESTVHCGKKCLPWCALLSICSFVLFT